MRFPAILSLILLLPVAESALSAGSDFHSELNRLTALALARSPGLKAMEQMSSSARIGSSFWNLLEDPELGLEWSRMQRIPTWTAGLMIPFPPRLMARFRALQSGRDIADVLFEQERLMLAARIAGEYALYCGLTDKSALLAEILALTVQTEEILTGRYAGGGASQRDVLTARLEADRMRNMLDEAKAERHVALFRLAALLATNISFLTSHPPLAVPPEVLALPPADSLPGLSDPPDRAPDLRAQDARLRQTRAAASLMRQEVIPDLMAGVKLPPDQPPMFMLSLRMPLNIFRVASGIRRAGLEERAEELKTEQIRADFGSALASGILAYEVLRRNFERQKGSMVPLSRQSLALDEAGFAAGRTALTDLLESRGRYILAVDRMHMTWSQGISLFAELKALTGAEP